MGGPTASGKSALARRLAREVDGVVINGDSLQLYRQLAILTARPTDAETAGVEHRLYGVLDAADAGGAQRWLDLARAEARRAWAAGRLPILAGGTGLYLSAFLNGLAPVPEVAPDVRHAVRRRLALVGA
ncbi:MAG: isopentenyl transferase family protein, partial [Alphaproteobacteria bacterium]